MVEGDLAARRRSGGGRFLTRDQRADRILWGAGAGVYRFPSHLPGILGGPGSGGAGGLRQVFARRSGKQWWREVILLEAGSLSSQRAARLIRAIAGCVREPELYYNLVLAGECLRDLGPGRVDRDLQNMVRRRLRKELDATSPLLFRGLRKFGPNGWIKRRSVAMEALVRAGVGYWTAPYGEPEWVEIPRRRILDREVK